MKTDRFAHLTAFFLLFSVVLIGCGDKPERAAAETIDLTGPWEWRRGELSALPKPAFQKIELPARLTALEELEKYRGHVTLRRALPATMENELRAGNAVAIFTGQISDVFRVYLNDTFVAGRGAEEPYRSGSYRIVLADLPGKALRAAGPNFIHIVVYTDGGYPIDFYGPEMKIGPAGALYRYYHFNELFTLLLLAAYALIGLYHLLLAIRRPKDIYNLYFGLFCLLVSCYWFFTTGTRDAAFGEAVLLRIKAEHFFLFLIGTPFLLFLSTFFNNRHSRIGLLAGAVHGGMALAILPGDYAWVLTLLGAWQISALPLMLYIVYYILRAWWQGRPDALHLITGVLLLMAAAIQDILANRGVLPTPQISKYFFILFLPGIAGILANRFTRVHNEAERLNEKLEEEVADRTRDLNATLKQLQFARSETDDILHSVQEGLFLISRREQSYMIGGQHSTELTAILEREVVAGQDFLEIMSPLLGEQKSASLEKYLAAMFDPAKKAKVVNKLNPLRQVEVDFPGDVAKHLEFHFNRVVRDANIVQLMATVKDVTRAVELARQLRLSEEKGRAAAERTQALLSVDPMMLSDFIEDTETEYSYCTELLRSPANEETLTELFRSLHSIKGNANLLHLTFIGNIAHRLESDIEQLQETNAGPDETGAKLSPSMKELGAVLEELKQWVARITDFQANYGQARTRSGEYFINVLNETVQRLARESGKDIYLKGEGFDYHVFPRARQKPVRDAIVQLVRNSISHGIEPPDVRQAAGKNPRGTITLSANQGDGRIVPWTPNL